MAIAMAACQSNHVSLDVQGHRGCRGLLPENTIPAFLRAVDLGVTTLELDVVMSGDGQVVVSHEAFLNPDICLDSSGKRIPGDTVINLYHMDYADIAKCDCGSLGNPGFPEQEKIPAAKPLLSEVIAVVKAHCDDEGRPIPIFNVEIKSSAKHVFMYHPAISVFANAVVAVLRENLPDERFTVQSFDVLTLQYLHRAHPDITLAYLIEQSGFADPNQISAAFEELGFTPQIYSCYYPMVTDEVVNWLHGRGILIIPWTVNEPDDMTRMINAGVDGIITDYPNRLIDLLKKQSRGS
jgi:glycerophosphoryl diester phosphodiesterase